MNHRVESTPVATALSDLHKLVAKYKMPRNLLVHRNTRPNLGTLEELEVFRFLQQTSEEMQLPQRFTYDRAAWDTVFHDEQRRLIEGLDCEIAEMCTHLGHLFDALYPIYLAAVEPV